MPRGFEGEGLCPSGPSGPFTPEYLGKDDTGGRCSTAPFCACQKIWTNRNVARAPAKAPNRVARFHDLLL